MIISSFHTGPDRNRVIYILIMRRGHSSVSKQILCLHMDPYVVPFHLGLGIGVIGPAFYISLVIWDPIHLFELLLNREIGLIGHLFDIYIRHSPDNSNRSNWMSNSGRSIEILHPCHIFHTSHQIDIIFMEYDSLSRCLGGEMVDTRDSKSRAKERGGSSPLQGIILRMLIE